MINQNSFYARKIRKRNTRNPLVLRRPELIRNAKGFKALRKLSNAYGIANELPERLPLIGAVPTFSPIEKDIGGGTKVIVGMQKMTLGVPFRNNPSSVRGAYRYWKRYGLVRKEVA